VLSQEPDWNKVPAQLQRLLRACLKKDPRERLSSIGDWRFLLEREEEEVEPRPVTRALASKLPWVAALLGLGIGAFGLFRFEKAGEPAVVRFDVPIPGGVGSQAHFALSPDGRQLAISAPEEGQLRLRVRPLDALEARLLPGTEGARFPFWKPDGRAIGFFADGKLKTVPPEGGPPAIITNLDSVVLGATWSPQGVIVFSYGRELYTVNEKGGAPALLYRGPGIPFEPAFLPDGRHFFYRENGTFVGALDGSPPVRILPDVAKALYSEGHLLFRRQGRLIAQPFDADTLTLSGAEIPVTSENVISAAQSESFSVARGVLAYQAPALEQLAWRDRAGTVTEKVGGPQQWRNFRLSPDQSKIAWDFETLGGVAVFNVQRGTRERFTTNGLVPVFSPDGTQIAFTSFRTGRYNPYITSAPNQERLIADVGTTGGYPVDWSTDGKYLLYWGDEDLWIVPIDKTEKPYTYAQSTFEERDGVFSPDGHWIAYTSNESGRFDIYLRPFPEEGGRRYPVSSQGGSGPAWRRDGKELFYVAGDGRLTAVPVTIRGSDVELGRAERLFPVTFGDFHRMYELSHDGKRVLVATPAAAGGAAITVLLNWRRVMEK
jgi:eukaryotic-like serine/threonine-protein kinase